MRSHPKLVPNLMHNLTPQFCPLHRCYYYWGKGSKSPYSKHQLAASEDVVQEGEISGYLKEKKTKKPSFSATVIFVIIIQATQVLGNTREAEGMGGLEKTQSQSGAEGNISATYSLCRT